MIEVTITKEDLIEAVDEGTIIVLTGTADDGSRVTFGADRRPAIALYEAAVASDEPVTAEIESWQVIGHG